MSRGPWPRCDSRCDRSRRSAARCSPDAAAPAPMAGRVGGRQPEELDVGLVPDLVRVDWISGELGMLAPEAPASSEAAGERAGERAESIRIARWRVILAGDRCGPRRRVIDDREPAQ